MATFGTPEPTENDASNALAAVIDMADAFETWKKSGSIPDISDMNLAIGVHYGTVIIGDIGREERLEFAVVGDAVNVASRLEVATRELPCRCLISEDLIIAADKEETSDISTLLQRLEAHAPMVLRGRSGETSVYVLR